MSNDHSPHWTENDMLDRLYGLDPAPELALSHFDACAECASRWQALELRRAVVVAPPMPSAALDEKLREQRHAVWARIEGSNRSLLWRAAPAAATACMLLAGIILQQPQPTEPVRQMAATVSDEQFFTDIASLVNQDSPRATDPIRGLFAENSPVEAQ